MSDATQTMQWLRFAPDLVPGTRLTPPDAPSLLAADAATYFTGLLAERMNAAMIMTSLQSSAARLTPEQVLAADDAIAQRYWGVYHGVLTPPPILRLLKRGAAGASGAGLIGLLDDARADIFDADELDGAAEVHADGRVNLLLSGAHEELDAEQVAIGEVLLDYLLIQRAIALDIRTAEDERESGEPRCAAVARLDHARRFAFERAIAHLMQTRNILERIPPTERPLIEAFARRRRHFAQAGVIATLAPSGQS